MSADLAPAVSVATRALPVASRASGEPAADPLRRPLMHNQPPARVAPAEAPDAVLSELAELFRCRRPFFVRVALRTVRDRLLADDVVQEAFLAACQHAGTRFDPARGPLESWVLMLVRHKTVDTVRHAEHLRRVRRQEEAEPHRVAGRDLPEDNVVRAEAAQHLTHGLAALPTAQQRVLVLAYWSGLTQSEIALADRTPLGTVKTRTALGLARLRAQLAPVIDES